ncbi:MAG: HAMP domain-containing histidine kinase [Sulfurovaceae bacterium]|nr:HAMP domain-containing histidine kinase [Sulfurovaceae bacterium]
MRDISVNVFINILFALVLTLLTGAFFAFVSLDKERQKNAQIARYKLISNALLSTASLNPSHEDMEKFYENSRVKPVAINANRLLILSKGDSIFEGESVYGRMQIFEVGDSNYIYLQRYGTNMMLKDIDSKKDVRIQLTIFIASLIALLFLFFYIVTMRKLAPLRKLNQEILEFAKGNMDVKITHKSRDEIGQIGQSFDDAIHHIKKLLDSKNLFMRNMMHELKTPITKGRIAVEMVEDGLSKRTLIRSFERMNELINELAHVEHITTQGFNKKLQEVSMSQIIDDSIELLLCDKNQLTIEIENEKIVTDEKLLILTLKNLIDNALKYGEGEKVEIKASKKSIKVISKGKSLEYPLAYYLEPFTQEEKRQSGFGLGLYIVNNVAKRLGYKLHYYYRNSSNVFELQL